MERSVLIAHPGSELYGSDRVMLDIAGALARRGWRVTVALPDGGPLVDALEATGAKVVLCPTPVLRRSILRPLGLLELLWTTCRSVVPGIRLVRRSGASVVYTSTLTIPLWPILGRVARRPVVAHVHEAEKTTPRLVRAIMATPLLAAHKVLVNSQFNLEVLTEAIPRLGARCRLVLNAVTRPPRVVPARDQLTPPLRLLYVGRLSPRKGPQHAIAALRELRRRGMHAELTLAGAVFRGYEWFEDQLRKDVADDGLSNVVHFVGFRDDIWPVLETADIALVPSIEPESFGNAAVEAVLAARPVVASTSGGLVEAVQGYASARSVPPGDPTALADAIESLCSSWNEVRAQALDDADVAARRHDPDHCAAQVQGVLDGLLDDRGRHPRR